MPNIKSIGSQYKMSEKINKRLILRFLDLVTEENRHYRLKKLGIDEYFKNIYVSKSMYKSKHPKSDKPRLLIKKTR